MARKQSGLRDSDSNDIGTAESEGGQRSSVKKRAAKRKASKGRRRGAKPYPTMPFEQALRFGEGVERVGSGHPVQRTTLFENLKLPINRATRDLITASSKYGITTGSHTADEFGLAIPDGAKAVEGTPSPERTRARIKLAIMNIESFRQLYERFRGRKIPAKAVMRDSLESLDEGDRAPCVDIFVQNAQFVGLLQTREGADWLIDREEEAIAGNGAASSTQHSTSSPVIHQTEPVDFERVCFFIAPIGEEGTEHRKHSDAILSSYVERALADVEPKLEVVRADKISQPGLITKQVIEYLLKSRLVVADLSYHNPNVFYELAVRHATGKPVIHVKRTSDPLPFDNKDFRTIDIPFEDKFDILAQIETVRSKIAQFSRQSLDHPDSAENPLLIYFSDHRLARREST